MLSLGGQELQLAVVVLAGQGDQGVQVFHVCCVVLAQRVVWYWPGPGSRRVISRWCAVSPREQSRFPIIKGFLKLKGLWCLEPLLRCTAGLWHWVSVKVLSVKQICCWLEEKRTIFIAFIASILSMR